jgi:hypothetical protein
MTARLCQKHGKPFPCGKCRIENAQKPAQTPPVSAVALMEPESAVAAVSAKRGRPRKYVDAAAKQGAYRERLSAKKQDSERRDIIAKMLKLVRVGMVSSNLTFGDQIKAENRLRVAQLHAELKLVSLEKLTEYLGTLEEHPDLEGRMWGERSGEAERAHGQSEMERIAAARQYDVSLGESSRQDPKLAGGFRVRPSGAAPDSSEKSDSKDGVRSGPIKSVEMPASEKQREKAIERIVDQMFQKSGQCLFCKKVFTNKLAAERHLFEMYEQGRKEDRKWGKYMGAVIHMAVETPAAGDLFREQPESSGTQHQRLIEQEARRRKLGNIVTNRFETEKSTHPTDTKHVSSAQPDR